MLAKKKSSRFAHNISIRARNFAACEVKSCVASRLEKFFSRKHRIPAFGTRNRSEIERIGAVRFAASR
jgi:hypothetical protein